MSEPSQEPGRIRRMSNSVSRWRNTRRGTKTLKAAYAKAASEATRLDPVVRERIGRANLSKADLQKLAEAHIAGQFGGNRDLSQTLDQVAADRVPANGRTNRFSRWRATRRGTKAVKAAYAQAARDVKKMDAGIRRQIGESRISRSDLQAMSRKHLWTVFRPEGRTGGAAPGPAPGAAPGMAPGAVAGAALGAPDAQQPAQLDALAEQILRTAELQLQATMLQNQRLQEIQQQLAEVLAQNQQQTAQPEVAQAETGQPETGQPEVGQAAAGQPEVAQAEAGQAAAGQPVVAQAEVGQAAAGQPEVVQSGAGRQIAQPEVRNPEHVGQHAVVRPEAQTPVRPQNQGPAQAEPQTDVRSDWVASGTGQGTRQPARPQVPAAQQSPREAFTGQQAAPEREGSTAELPSAQREAPSWQTATNAEAAASNEQWTPNPERGGPDMSAQNQADMKGEMSKLHHVAFTGTAQPRIQAGEQSRPTGERPAGTEAHRSSGPGADRNNDTRGR